MKLHVVIGNATIDLDEIPNKCLILVWDKLTTIDLTHFASIFIMNSGVVGSGRRGGLRT